MHWNTIQDVFRKPTSTFLSHDCFSAERERTDAEIFIAGGTDPHAFSDFWQIPSGSPKPSDPTMLHALARFIFDQTGLRLTSVVTLSGSEKESTMFKNGEAQRMRLLFMVEVAELGSVQPGNIPDGKDSGYESQALDVNSLPIALDVGRYRRHAWSTEEDLKELVNSGLYPAEERAQYRMMLHAFFFHKQNLAYLDSLNQHSQGVSSSHGLHI